MIYALRHIPTGKYVSKMRSCGFRKPAKNYDRDLVDLHEACFWGKLAFVVNCRKQRKNPEDYEIVKFSLIEEK